MARGSAFQILGTGLGPERAVKSGVPLVYELGGVQVTLTDANGAVTPVPLSEVSGTKIVAVAPSKLAEGDYELRVRFEGEESEPAALALETINPGIVTVPGLNWAMAVAEAGDVESYQMSYTKPLVAGQFVAILAAGFGPSDNDTGLPGEQQKLDGLIVVVGGVEAPAFYAGRKPDRPGYDQVVFQLPESDLPLGCVVPVLLRYENLESEPAYLSISNDPANPCTHPAGLNLLTLTSLERGGTAIIPEFSILDNTFTAGEGSDAITIHSRALVGSFSEHTQASIASIERGFFARNTAGGCTLISVDESMEALPAPTTLDAGAELTLRGPDGVKTAIPRMDGNVYLHLLAQEVNGTPTPGTPGIQDIPGIHRLAGAGGLEIDLFESTLDLAASIPWSNKDDVRTVKRDSDLEIRWAPGSPNDSVLISGASGLQLPVPGATEGETYFVGVQFACEAPAEQGSFVVPSAILQRLPATNAEENGFSTLTFGQRSRLPNGRLQTKTRAGRVTETGLFGSNRGYTQTVVIE